MVTPGTRLGPYEVTSQIGVGGMGEVYRARDMKLDCDVAIKVLPESLAADPDRIARFQREAKTLAALNHPNIAAIYGLEEAGGVKALVMELVEGPTLGDRIAQGPIPDDEALPIAKQIAEALEAAHEQGIIHRDLKPANVKVRSDGAVKVLDFGLAKAMEPAGALSPSVSQSPTITTPAMTQAGMILGTAAYMSPEQARGKPVDKRTDVWAFGCVLYEMLTGQRAFPGEDVTDVLAAVVRAEPDWTQLPAEVQPALRRLLRRALVKDRRDRLPDIAVARLEIAEAVSGVDAVVTPQTVGATARRERVAWAVASATLLLVTLALASAMYSRGEPADPPAYQVTVSIPPDVQASVGAAPVGRLALSPDGRRLAFLGRRGEVRLTLDQIWVQELDESEAQPLSGTDGAAGLFWSPDSRNLGFFVDGKLKRIDVAGGPSQTVCDAPGVNFSGTWSGDSIYFGVTNSPIQRVAALGGAPTPVTTLDEAAGENRHSVPWFLPDGRQFLFLAFGGPSSDANEPVGVYTASLEGSARKLILPGGSNAKYANGHLLFLRGQTLMAQPFDVERLELTGQAKVLAEGVATGGPSGVTGAFSVSETGVLAFQTSPGQGLLSRLTWFDRSGRQVGTLGEVSDYGDVALSPDGLRVVASVLDPARNTRDLWVYDAARGLGTRLTSDAGNETGPVWAPDSTRILFTSQRKGQGDLTTRLADGSGDEEVVVQDQLQKFAYSWSSDGRSILYNSAIATSQTGSDVYLLPLAGGQPRVPILQTRFNEGRAVFSPAGQWIAYASNETGAYEIYVTGADSQGKWRVSSAGGDFPRWRRDGQELFYVSADNTLMAASVDARGAAFRVVSSTPLFRTQPRGAGRYDYDVTRDGQRFIVNNLVDEQTSSTRTSLIIGWPAVLAQRSGTR